MVSRQHVNARSRRITSDSIQHSLHDLPLLQIELQVNSTRTNDLTVLQNAIDIISIFTARRNAALCISYNIYVRASVCLSLSPS